MFGGIGKAKNIRVMKVETVDMGPKKPVKNFMSSTLRVFPIPKKVFVSACLDELESTCRGLLAMRFYQYCEGQNISS